MKIPMWIIFIIIFNIVVFAMMLNPMQTDFFSMFRGENTQAPIPVQNQTPQPPVQTPKQTSNQSVNKTSNQTSNQTNFSIYYQRCISSIDNYIKSVSNVTSFKTIESRFFNKTEDSISYARNWSTNSFEMIGIGRDISLLNKTNKSSISVNDFTTTNGKNFTLPIVCNENGTIQVYSLCMLSNITNITISCHNLAESFTECDIEKMQYDFWQDISYWITPKPGPLNDSQLFNFTIISSRNRLEYAKLNVFYRRPGIDLILFNNSASTMKGDKIALTTRLNLTGKIYGGLILEAWFKKKCYKYDILAQYLYDY